MPNIFISYRRQDKTAAANAGRLYDRLAAEFGKSSIFMDIDTVKAGKDFVDSISRKVGECDALVAMIGEEWLAITDVLGNRRLDNPEDWVRLEIAVALKRDIQVIPALVYGALLPRSADLPKPLKKLARRQAVEITHQNFHQDVNRLIRDLEESPPDLSKNLAPEHKYVRKKAQLPDGAPVKKARGTKGTLTGVKTVHAEPSPHSGEIPLGVYLDPKTKNMWISKDNWEDINWHEAAKYAKELTVGGYTDWRLPTIDELAELYDPGVNANYKIRKPFELSGGWVWSSTKCGPASANSFVFGIGQIYPNYLDATGLRALCVRLSQE